MRVDNNVWLHSALRERHVNRWPLLGAYTFLAVSRRELVTNDRRASDPQRYLDLLCLGIAQIVAYHDGPRFSCLNSMLNGAKMSDLVFEPPQHRLFRRPCT